MSTLVRCDCCGEEANLSPLNWWVLDVFGRKVDAYGDNSWETPYHLCSLDCVSKFAASLAKEGLMRKTGPVKAGRWA